MRRNSSDFESLELACFLDQNTDLYTLRTWGCILGGVIARGWGCKPINSVDARDVYDDDDINLRPGKTSVFQTSRRV